MTSNTSTTPPDNPFLDLMEWRERRSAESAFGRLSVVMSRVMHTLPVWRLTRRF